MNRVSWMVGLGAGVVCQFAMADVPQVMDQMPADASVMVVVSRLSDVREAVESMEATVGAPMGGPGEMIKGLSMLEGIDASRSMGIYVPAGFNVEEETEPKIYALVPVTDFDAFAQSLGGQVEDGIATLQVEGQPGYAKSASDGYAIVSPARELIEAYEASTGQAKANEQRLGSTAAEAASSSDIFIAADIKTFAEQINEFVTQATGQMQMMAMMAGQDMGPQSAIVAALGKHLVEDGRIGFLALDHSAEGMKAGFGVQFNDGTQSAEYLSGGGNASRLLAKVPGHDILFAYAADMSTPGAKKINEAMTNAFGQQGIPGMKAAAMDADGVAMVMGKSPGGLMGGALFAATSLFFEVDDPKGHIEKIESALTAMNDQQIEGTTFVTSVQKDAVTVKDSALDSWSIRMQLDPQVGGQAQMAIAMIFGPTGGPAGYLAPAKDGVVMTLAKNAELAGEAIEVANNANGLGTSELVKKVASHLPEERLLEGYVSVSNFIEMSLGMMAMAMPGGAPQVDIPEGLAPVGFGLSTGEGAFEFQGFAPQDVIKLVVEVQKAIEEAQGGGAVAPAEEESGRPRF